MGVTVSEYDIARDESERSNLQRAISDIETAVAVSNPGTRRILENTLENAKKRIMTLDKRIDEAKVEHAAEVQAQVAAAAALAAKETKLNAGERETYRGFLEKSYFTKKDFGKLDEFYTHSYDKLSEGGKEEMSKRIHEGIRRGEFREADLPETVLEKDNTRQRKHSHIETTESNNRTPDAGGQSRAHNGANNLSDNKLASNKPTSVISNQPPDLSAVDLKGIKLVTTNVEPTVAAMPDAMGTRVNGRA